MSLPALLARVGVLAAFLLCWALYVVGFACGWACQAVNAERWVAAWWPVASFFLGLSSDLQLWVEDGQGRRFSSLWPWS